MVVVLVFILKFLCHCLKCSKKLIECCRFRRPRARIPGKILFGIILGSIWAVTARGCAETMAISATQNGCAQDKKGWVKYSFESDMLLALQPNNQTVCILLKDMENRSLGSMALKIQETVATCQKETLFFSRHRNVQVASVRKCPTMGSCVTNACSKVRHQDQILELGPANHFPGYTRCTDGPSCWANGCFHCEPACLFYRVHAVPSGDQLLEIFGCPTFQVGVHLEVTMRTHKGKIQENLNLLPGRITHLDNMRFELSSVSVPPVPVLGTRLITDGERVATLTEEDL